MAAEGNMELVSQLLFTPGVRCAIAAVQELPKAQQKQTIEFAVNFLKYSFEKMKSHIPEKLRSGIEKELLPRLDTMDKLEVHSHSPKKLKNMKGGARQPETQLTRKLTCVERNIQEQKALRDDYKALLEMIRSFTGRRLNEREARYLLELQTRMGEYEREFREIAERECKSSVGSALVAAGCSTKSMLKSMLEFYENRERVLGASVLTGIFVWSSGALLAKGSKVVTKSLSALASGPAKLVGATASGIQTVLNFGSRWYGEFKFAEGWRSSTDEIYTSILKIFSELGGEELGWPMFLFFWAILFIIVYGLMVAFTSDFSFGLGIASMSCKRPAAAAAAERGLPAPAAAAAALEAPKQPQITNRSAAQMERLRILSATPTAPSRAEAAAAAGGAGAPMQMLSYQPPPGYALVPQASLGAMVATPSRGRNSHTRNHRSRGRSGSKKRSKQAALAGPPSRLFLANGKASNE